MADFTAGPDAGDVGTPTGSFVNAMAAAVSLALIGGVGVWGYQLLMRDVTGVPVVRAMEGDMRVAPTNPGGEIATHVGLSVNSVPAEGGAAEPEDRLILAPNTSALVADDMNVGPTAEADEMLPEADMGASEEVVPAALAVEASGDPSTPLTAEDVLALADQIAAAGAPAPVTDGQEVAVDVAAVVAGPTLIPDSVPGVRRSLRPTSRPANLAAPVAVAASAVSAEITTTPIPVGTKLVQLGAFDSPEIAATEWVRMTTRFPDFFDGKDRIIQEATSGGRTFFRLRALGFADLSDARRFCAALSGEGAACIPVVVR